MPSVLKPWVEQLGLRHQGVLMACVRGCDSVPKEDATKALARCLRGVLLNSFDPKPTSVIENVDDEELRRRMVAVLKNHDHYPIHYIIHLMHAAEIVGYKHPDKTIRGSWRWLYEKLARCFHLNVETEEQLDARLGACEDRFARQAASAVRRLALFLPVLSVLFVSCSRTPTPPKPPAPPYDAALRDGSVIFWQGGLLVKPILKHTDSDLTHAAIVLYQGHDPFVYEAVPPRVHKVPLAEYRKLMAEKVDESRRPMTWFVMQPMDSYAPSQLAAMKAHADSQLGRPYMLRGWWKGHEVRGIFCSKLVGDVIARSGKIEASGIHESPGSLHDKLLPFYWELSTP